MSKYKSPETRAKECSCEICKKYLRSVKDSENCGRPRRVPRHLQNK